MPFLKSRIPHHFFMGGVLFVVLAALLLASVVIWAGSSYLIQPTRRPLEARHRELLASPQEFGLALESDLIRADDGVELHALLATRSSTPGAATRTRAMEARLRAKGHLPSSLPRGTIVLLHGRGGIKENMLWVAQRFVAADFRCIVYDARAHGQSGGRHCTFGEKEVGDLASILRHYESSFAERGETLGPIGAFGNSLGAAVVLQSLDSPTDRIPTIDASVAVAPFATLSPIVVAAARKKIHRHLPESLILASMRVGGWRAGFDPLAIKPVSGVKRSSAPLFLAHGSLDGVIPVDHSHHLRIHSQASPLVWREIAEGFHSNVLAEGGDDLYEQMTLFFLEHLRSPAVAATGSNR